MWIDKTPSHITLIYYVKNILYTTFMTNIIYCFWTGTNPMSKQRRLCLEQLKKVTFCDVVLVTPDSLGKYLLDEHPLHPSFFYLSQTHKADYLRTYFMRFHGGGYTDIKQTTGSWLRSFQQINNSDKWIIGYKEIRGGVWYPPLSNKWCELLGNCAYICKPNTPFVVELLIAGASGSGKTSLLEVISGLSAARSGSISWKGTVMTRRQRRGLCGIVFQFPERHFLGLNVSQELRLGHRRLGNDRQDQVLQRVGLQDIPRNAAPERLSGGQQRRLALAVQLLRGAEVLLLDEPTAGLDWSVRSDVLTLLSDLAEEQVLIVVTHEPELFDQWDSDRLRLESGQLTPMTTLP